jgi:hypothetical protein
MLGKVEREVELPDRAPEGLKDGGHVYLACSNCRARAVDVFVTRPHEPEVWKLQANCDFCGDKTFLVEVKGGFHYGGVALSKDEEPDEDRAVSTIVESVDIQEDRFFFKTKKAHPNAKPTYR